MNFKPLLQPLGLAVLLLASQAAPRGADVHGEHENPNQAFGQEASYKLDGETKFGKARMWVAIRSRNQRSWLMTSTQPAKFR